VKESPFSGSTGNRSREKFLMAVRILSPMARIKQTKGKAVPNKSHFVDLLSGMLTTSLREKQDFIITFEPADEENETCEQVHVMTGRLINSCMLNALKHCVSLYSDEGARVVTRQWC